MCERLDELILPAAADAQRAEVGHDGRHLVPPHEVGQRGARLALEQRERDAQRPQLRLHLGQALEHEAVVPDGRAEEPGHHAEGDGEADAVLVGQLARVEQRPVVLHALVAAHPVHDASRRWLHGLH
eukprot:scaffold6440_cov68-Phaeocystis_antarctica.AAC.2